MQPTIERAHDRVCRVEIPKAFTLDPIGIWRLAQNSSVCYPKAGNQEAFALEADSVWYRHRNQCLVAAIRRFPPSGPIWDIGGGNGCVTQALLDAGFPAVLLEPDPQAVLNAKKWRLLPLVLCGALENSGLETGSIAAVGIFDVLEHIQDDRAALDTIHRILKPGGILYGAVPAHQWLWSHHDVALQHHRRYNERELLKILSRSFHLLYFSYFFGPLLLPILLFRVLAWRFGSTKCKLSASTEHCIKPYLVFRFMLALLRPEAWAIKRGRRLWMGTSCLFIARKLAVTDM